MGDRIALREAARRRIGWRCRWNDEGSGTVVDVTVGGGGYGRYVVEWDDDCPPWWGSEVSLYHGPSFIVEAPTDG